MLLPIPFSVRIYGHDPYVDTAKKQRRAKTAMNTQIQSAIATVIDTFLPLSLDNRCIKCHLFSVEGNFSECRNRNFLICFILPNLSVFSLQWIQFENRLSITFLLLVARFMDMMEVESVEKEIDFEFTLQTCVYVRTKKQFMETRSRLTDTVCIIIFLKRRTHRTSKYSDAKELKNWKPKKEVILFRFFYNIDNFLMFFFGSAHSISVSVCLSFFRDEEMLIRTIKNRSIGQQCFIY